MALAQRDGDGIALVRVLLGMTGLDFTTSVSGAAAALANIGPGLERVGSIENYGWPGNVRELENAVEAAINPWLDKLLDQILEFEKIKISKHLSRELPTVPYDQEKLRRVIINVVDNAIQAVKAKEQEGRNKVTAYHPEIQVATRAGGGAFGAGGASGTVSFSSGCSFTSACAAARGCVAGWGPWGLGLATACWAWARWTSCGTTTATARSRT